MYVKLSDTCLAILLMYKLSCLYTYIRFYVIMRQCSQRYVISVYLNVIRVSTDVEIHVKIKSVRFPQMYLSFLSIEGVWKHIFVLADDEKISQET